MRIEVHRNKKIKIIKSKTHYLINIPLQIITRREEKDYKLSALSIKGKHNKTKIISENLLISWELEEYKYNEKEIQCEVDFLELNKGSEIIIDLELFFEQLGKVFIEIPYRLKGRIIKMNDIWILEQVKFYRRRRSITLINILLILSLPLLFTFWSGQHDDVFDSKLSQQLITKLLAVLTALATFLGISREFFTKLNLTKFLDRVFFNIELYYSKDLIKLLRHPAALLFLLSFNLTICGFIYYCYPVNIPKAEDKYLLPFIGKESLSGYKKIYWKDRDSIKWYCCDEAKIKPNANLPDFVDTVHYSKLPPLFSKGEYKVKARKIALVNYKECQDKFKNKLRFTPKEIMEELSCRDVIKAIHRETSDEVSLDSNGIIKIKSSKYKDIEINKEELGRYLQEDYILAFFKKIKDIDTTSVLRLFKDRLKEDYNNGAQTQKVIMISPSVYKHLMIERLQGLNNEKIGNKSFYMNSDKLNYYNCILQLFGEMLKEDLSEGMESKDLSRLHGLGREIFQKLIKKHEAGERKRNQDEFIQELIAFLLIVKTPNVDKLLLEYIDQNLNYEPKKKRFAVNLYSFDNIFDAIEKVQSDNKIREILTSIIDKFFKEKKISTFHSNEYFKTHYINSVGKLMEITSIHNSDYLFMIDNYIWEFHLNRKKEEQRNYNNIVLNSYIKELDKRGISYDESWKCIKYMRKN